MVSELPLRVLLCGTSYPRTPAGWQGLFIQQMVQALASRPELALNLWLPPGETPANTQRIGTEDDEAWLGAMLDGGGIAHLLRTSPIRGAWTAVSLLRRLRRACRTHTPDIYHVNWLQNALALPDDARPALVTILGTDLQLLRLPLVAPLLRRTFSRRKVMLCPNADWMVEPLRLAFDDKVRVDCVPLGIDDSWFRVERILPKDGVHRWLCVSRLTAHKLGPLFEWCAPCFADGRRELHLFGPMQEQVVIPNWVRYHGPATPTQLRGDWFPSTTGLISLSRHAEGRPQVMLEAMAAGLPILASDLSAHADIVSHAQTGWLCDHSQGVMAGLEVIEDPVRNEEMGLRARAQVRAKIGTWDDCAARYTAFYQILLQGEAQ